MFLYNLDLQSPSLTSQAIIGNFSGTKQQEFVLAKQTHLELLRIDTNTGKFHSVLEHNVFGVIRSIAAFRLTGASKDYIVIGSDSGRIVILEYNPAKNVFDKVHQETFGKSGCRRIVPGQYLACDPKGRAVMIGAVEKSKFVYILNRDSAARLTISSPLEAHKSHTILYHMTGVDVGFDNPVFACLEVDYSDADQDPTGEALERVEKVLTYYELDLGLNHVVRKWSEAVDTRSNYLLSVPGGTDGPSGVLVCTENCISWRHPGQPEHRVPIPRRMNYLEDANRGLLIVTGVMHKMKNAFFVLLQSEEGDIYKLTIDHSEGEVQSLRIKYFDTVPVASSLVILKAGFLYVASEMGNHTLYQIENLGDDDEEQPEYVSTDFINEDGEFDEKLVYFRPRPLRNLVPVDEIESLAALVDAKVLNITEDETPQIYALCGRSSRSSFRILRHGLEITEMAVSELPGNPKAVWTVKTKADEEFDSFIVVSFTNATLVLSIGETVEEVTDTGFLANVSTLLVKQMGEEDLVQVYPNGIRHIRSDKRVNEWKTPGNRTVTHATANNRQIVISLTGGEIVYFELDPSGNLNEYPDRKEMSAPVTALSIGEIPEGRLRSRFVAIGCMDSTVRVLSLDPESVFDGLSMQALNTPAESLLILALPTTPSSPHGTLFLNIGLQNGVLIRSILDDITGALTDTRLRFLGPKPVKLFSICVNGGSAVLALSSKPWIGYVWQSRVTLSPVSYEALEWASGFRSEQCEEGVVAVTGNTLRIIAAEKLGKIFHQSAIPLSYTPRRFTQHPGSKNFVIIETDNATYGESALQSELKKKAEEFEDESVLNYPEEFPPEQFGNIRSESGKWASCIRVVNPFTGDTLQKIELEDNEAAFCVTTIQFASAPEDMYLVVGTGKDVMMAPRTCSAGYIHLYKFVNEGTELEFMHKTQVDDVPLAFCPFQGRLLAGIGNVLRIYDIGKKKLLRKCENKQAPNLIVSLETQGSRIVIGDISESFHYATYRQMDNRIIVFADDTTSRYLTSSTMMDYETIAGGDKFGNFWVNRLDSKVTEEIDDDPTGNKGLMEKGYLGGAPNKTAVVANFHLGDIATHFTKTSLVPGGRDVLLYTTLGGGIGFFVPFLSKDDVDFFQSLEMAMRNEMPPLCGRDHLAWRSYYTPVKSVIDGNLCEQYNVLPPEKKRSIAEDLDRSPAEISKKLEDMRTRVAF
ncbi:CPSF A subunit region-domain-containing protein [Paraphysoderma sedebokerense]|nr:CPSF A subunit region-domain-containing protein [Paraphysoderma sedebokerense]